MNLKAEEAIIQAHNERGYVVVGYPPKADFPDEGAVLQYFGGVELTRHCLVVESATDREDWDNQVRLWFGNRCTARNPPKKRSQRFYRCRLEPIP